MVEQSFGGVPEAWETRTHVWAEAVDADHLREARERFAWVPIEHRILEVAAYAEEEAEAREVIGRVSVTLADRLITVDDDGRGTDTRVADDGRTIRKPVMSTKDVRFFGRDDAPRLPDGIARHGMSVVAANSAVLTHENHRSTGSWVQSYRFGIPDEELQDIAFRGHTGTTVRFSVSGAQDVDARALASMLAAFPSLDVDVRDDRTPGDGLPVD